MANSIKAFVSYKRSLGKKFFNEEKNLRLLDHYLVEQKIIHINNITPDIIDSFLTSRPRKRARSYNDLVGLLDRFFNWLVVQEIITKSPLKTKRRRDTDKQIPYIFDTTQARRLFEAASCLADSSSALKICEPPVVFSEAFHKKPLWRDDENLLNWLNTL
ncbi:MAG: hypothetical protein HKP41_13970 [Desulfobacterales bacterium]|nr:hypothetical protein [Desulfobacterales bacterium]